jgi:hypothetical protein
VHGSISIGTDVDTSTVGDGVLVTLFMKTQLSFDLRKLLLLSPVLYSSAGSS